MSLQVYTSILDCVIHMYMDSAWLSNLLQYLCLLHFKSIVPATIILLSNNTLIVLGDMSVDTLAMH